MGASVAPMQSAFTRMPCSASFCDHACVSPFIAHFEDA